MPDINVTYTGFLLDMLPKSAGIIMFKPDKEGVREAQNYVRNSLEAVLKGETFHQQGEFPVSREDLVYLSNLMVKKDWCDNLRLFDEFLEEAHKRAQEPYQRPEWLQKILSIHD